MQLAKAHPIVARRGFTLIELLVVLGVIAILIAILLPALAAARRAARETLCLSNQRQLAIAWAAYTEDYHAFPFPSSLSSDRLDTGWGGVDWYGGATSPGVGFNLTPDRVVNPYVSGEQQIQYRAAFFKCPLDSGFHYWRTGTSDLESLGDGSNSGELNTVFGVAGNSYRANLWMWCKPGATGGWGTGSSAGVNLRRQQGPQHVYVAPSQFVVFGDHGPMNWLVSTVAQRDRFNLGGGWWHGPERSPLAFLDGSVRVEKTGLIVCDRYSMHMVPISPAAANSGYLWPNHAP